MLKRTAFPSSCCQRARAPRHTPVVTVRILNNERLGMVSSPCPPPASLTSPPAPAFPPAPAATTSDAMIAHRFDTVLTCGRDANLLYLSFHSFRHISTASSGGWISHLRAGLLLRFAELVTETHTLALDGCASPWAKSWAGQFSYTPKVSGSNPVFLVSPSSLSGTTVACVRKLRIRLPRASV